MKKILVIEDEKSLRKNLVDLLEIFCYTVAEASNGAEGIELAGSFQPDIILCDLTMQGLDGYMVFDKMKAISKLQAIPFIFLSGIAEPEEIEKATALGAAYQVKPFKANELIDKIQLVLGQ